MKSNFDELNNYRKQKIACCMTCSNFKVRLDNDGYDEEYCVLKLESGSDRYWDRVGYLSICDLYKEFELT